MGYYFYHNHHSFHITPYILLFPVLILMMALIGLGLGMLISAMTTKYRDLSFLVSFGVQLLMYATTVVYPLSVVMTKFPTYHYLISLNPMSIIIETFRLGFLGTGSFSWLTFSFSVGVTLVVTLFGIIVFNKVERNFIDTV
jgi:lipopolysaccharide transport system permease protein